MPDEEELSGAFETDWGPQSKDVRVVLSFVRVSGRWVETMGEDRDDQDCARHPLLIERLSAITGGALVVEHLSQVDRVSEGGETTSIVQFVSDNRVYRAETEAFGRAFDLHTVREVLNRALSDQGRTARFVPIRVGDTAQYLFGDPDAIAAACEQLFIPVGDDRPSYKQFLKRVDTFWRKAGGGRA